jgi:hypothetical protein
LTEQSAKQPLLGVVGMELFSIIEESRTRRPLLFCNNTTKNANVLLRNAIAKPPPHQTSNINFGEESLNSVSNAVESDSTIYTPDTMQPI